MLVSGSTQASKANEMLSESEQKKNEKEMQ